MLLSWYCGWVYLGEGGIVFVIGQRITMKCEYDGKRVCIDGWRREGGMKSEIDGELNTRRVFSHVLSKFPSLGKERKLRKERKLINCVVSMHGIYEYLDRCYSLTIQ
jgi:hypothetical protein